MTFQGLQLFSEINGPGETHVVWKKLVVRANSITGLPQPATTQAELVTELTAHGSSLTTVFQYDLTAADPPANVFARWGNDDLHEWDSQGMTVTQTSGAKWTSSSLIPQIGMSGDFDIAINLDVLKIDQPTSPGNSGVYINLMYGEERTGLVALSFVRQLSGQTEIYAQLRHRKDEDTRRYELLRALSLDKVSTLRLIRRDRTLYFLCAQPGMEDLRLLAQYNIGTEVIPLRGVRMSVHTSGEGKETVVRWRNVAIRTESVTR